MRLKVISLNDGTGVHVVEEKTGEELEGVVQTEWQQGEGGEPIVMLVLREVSVEIHARPPAPRSPFIGATDG